MKQTFKIFPAMAITLTLAMAFASVNVSAVAGGTASFDCFLTVDETEAIPAVTFTYSIASGNAVAATETTSAVTAGPVVTGDGGVQTAPTIGSAEFVGGETTTDSAADGITLASGKKYAKKTVNVDFSGITFSEVGTYRYVITESVEVNGASYDTDSVVVRETYNTPDTADDAILYTVSQDTQTGSGATPRTRYMDVYVMQGDSGLEVSYVLHETAAVGTVDTAGGSVSDKSAGIVNSVSSHNLTFGKEVTGNQGSKNQYFTFTLTLGGLPTAGEKYAVNLTNAESSPDGHTNYNVITAASDGSPVTATAVFYLKDGQYITVQGLPDNFTYQLSEDNAGYTPLDIDNDNIAGGITAANNASGVAHTDPVASETGVTRSIRTGFTNERNGIIPTGLLLTVTPFVVGLFLFGALFFYMLAGKRKKY